MRPGRRGRGGERTCRPGQQDDGPQQDRDERQTVTEVAGQPEQQARAQRGCPGVPGRAGRGEGQQCHGPRRDGGEVAVRGGAGPDGEGGEDEERSRAPGEVLVRQGAQRDQDGHRGRAAEHDAPHARPGAAPESGPVQADEGECGARRVTRDVGGPVARRADDDVVREPAQGGADVVEPVDHAQVFVLGGQPARDPPVPALDEGEREDPRHRAGPAREQQPPPGEPRGQPWPVGDDRHRHRHGGRGAGAEMRVPGGQEGWPLDLKAAVALLDHPADPYGRGHQQNPAAAAVRSRRRPTGSSVRAGSGASGAPGAGRGGFVPRSSRGHATHRAGPVGGATQPCHTTVRFRGG